MSESQNLKKAENLDFSGLILGFSSAVLHHLGESTSSLPNARENLELARQNIEIIALLKDKTSGNLTVDEKELIDGVLEDLQKKIAEKK